MRVASPRVLLLLLGALFGLSACVADNPATTDDGGPRPDEGVSDRGVDPDDRGEGCSPAIELSTDRLAFPRGPAFEPQTREVRVTSVGDCPAEVAQISVSGAPSFRPEVAGVDPRQDSTVLDDPDRDGAPGLAPGASFIVTVVFTPNDDSPKAGELSIFAASGEHVVELTGNQAGPCLDLAPVALEFRGEPGEVREAELTLTSCGDAPTTVQDVALTDQTSPAFSLVMDAPFPAVLAPAGAAAETERVVKVRFAPDAPGSFNGAIVIDSDGLSAPARVQLVGRAQENACPIAVAGDDAFIVEAGDVVTLDGSASRDPDGPGGLPLEWRWRVLERPDGSIAQPVEGFNDPQRPAETGVPDNITTPEALFFVDIPGRYVLELEVIDAQGLSSDTCATSATVVLQTGSAGRLQFQLTWTTPADLVPDDARGADVDLEASYAGVTCGPATPTPDWAPEGPANDPVYDADDRAGGGPENIIIDRPEGAEPYIISAIYDDPNGFGPSFATLRVFLDGALVAEDRAELLLPGDRHDFRFQLP